jgi:hypothetical protein
VLRGGVQKKNMRKPKDWLERGDGLGKKNKGGRKVCVSKFHFIIALNKRY